MSGERSSTSGSGRTYLDSVSAVFEQNHKERQNRMQAQRVRNDVALAHSQYLQRNVVSPVEFSAARSTVTAWANKHDVVSKALKRLRRRGHSLFHSPPAHVTSPFGRRRILKTLTSQSRDKMTHVENMPNANHTFTEGSTHISGTVQDLSLKSVGRSRSSTPRTANDSEDGEVVYLSDEESEDGPLSCSVVNCWAVFSHKEYLRRHIEGSKHSPCNPASTLTDGQLVIPPQLYMCPLCGHLCQGCLACQEHMVMCDHLPLMFPLPVVAFTCPQCLALFPDQVTCHDHMCSQNHRQFTMPFSGDNSAAACPVPVPQSFAEEFLQRCAREHSTVRCIDCDVDSSVEEKWQEHQRDHGNQHTSVAHSATSHVDVLLKFLCDKACDTCSQILYLSPGASGGHICSEGVTGSSVDMNVDTFAEFVRCCSVSTPKVASAHATTTSCE